MNVELTKVGIYSRVSTQSQTTENKQDENKEMSLKTAAVILHAKSLVRTGFVMN